MVPWLLGHLIICSFAWSVTWSVSVKQSKSFTRLVGPLVVYSVGRFIDLSVGWLASHFTSLSVPLVGGSVPQPVGQLVCPLKGRSFSRHIRGLVSILVGLTLGNWFLGCKVSSLACWSVGLSIDWSVLWSIHSFFSLWIDLGWSALQLVAPSVCWPVLQFVPIGCSFPCSMVAESVSPLISQSLVSLVPLVG